LRHIFGVKFGPPKNFGVAPPMDPAISGKSGSSKIFGRFPYLAIFKHSRCAYLQLEVIKRLASHHLSDFITV